MSGDIHALSGAYAVGALDEAERVEFEKHLAECEACRDEVDGLREAATALAELNPVEPPRQLRGQVLRDIGTVRPLAPVVGLEARRTRRRRSVLAAVAAVLVLAAGSAVVWHPWTHDSTGEVASPVHQVIHAADAQSVRHPVAGGGTLTVYWSDSLDRVAVVTRDLPGAPAGKVYEMWLQDSTGSMQPAGVVPDRANAAMVLNGSPSQAHGVGMTVEPDGGSPAPTSDPIALVPLPSA